jgi:hypothetical protein
MQYLYKLFLKYVLEGKWTYFWEDPFCAIGTTYWKYWKDTNVSTKQLYDMTRQMSVPCSCMIWRDKCLYHAAVRYDETNVSTKQLYDMARQMSVPCNCMIWRDKCQYHTAVWYDETNVSTKQLYDMTRQIPFTWSGLKVHLEVFSIGSLWFRQSQQSFNTSLPLFYFPPLTTCFGPYGPNSGEEYK